MKIGISVIMPNFNKGPFLASAIGSVQRQSYVDYELIIVDDASTDSSMPIIDQFHSSDDRIRLIEHQENLGVGATLNDGIRATRSPLLTFMGSDDLFSRERLQRIVAHLEAATEPSVLYSDPIYVSTETVLNASDTGVSSFRPSGAILKYLLRGAFRFHGGPIAAPKSCFDAVGLFDEALQWGEDLDMCLRLAARYAFIYDRVSTYGYRIHDQNTTARITKNERWAQQGSIVERHLLENLACMDSDDTRRSFGYLFGCYVASKQWRKILEHALTNRNGFQAMIDLPRRALRKQR